MKNEKQQQQQQQTGQERMRRKTFTANGKREFVPRDQVFRLLIHYNYTNIGRFTPILSMTIVLSCFYLLISNFENFSTSISRLLFAANARLNLSKDTIVSPSVQSIGCA